MKPSADSHVFELYVGELLEITPRFERLMTDNVASHAAG